MRPPATRAAAPGPGSTTPRIPAETSIRPRSFDGVTASLVDGSDPGAGAGAGAVTSAAGPPGGGGGSALGGFPLLALLNPPPRPLLRRAGVSTLQVGQVALQLAHPFLVEPGGHL